MIKRWLIYLATLLGSILFYWAHHGWLAWLLLLFVLTLPLFSLLVSLPAMLTVRVGVRCAGILQMGEAETPALTVRCKLPAPPVRGRIRVKRTLSGESRLLKPGGQLPTGHCGQLLCSPERVSVYDYLGLFRLTVHRRQRAAAVVRPQSLAMTPPAQLDRWAARSWKPKPGGGFSENHELRLYRPGDSLNQVHWKLTAKTGKLMIREAMEPLQGLVLLCITVQGSDEELDRKFGRLHWMGNYLLQQELRYELRALTGQGQLAIPVSCEHDLICAIDRLLSMPAAAESAEMNTEPAAWQLHIGGDADEA